MERRRYRGHTTRRSGRAARDPSTSDDVTDYNQAMGDWRQDSGCQLAIRLGL